MRTILDAVRDETRKWFDANIDPKLRDSDDVKTLESESVSKINGLCEANLRGFGMSDKQVADAVNHYMVNYFYN